jgi:hypothetical protein
MGVAHYAQLPFHMKLSVPLISSKTLNIYEATLRHIQKLVHHIFFLHEIHAKLPNLDVQQKREEKSIKPIHSSLSEK